MNTPVNRDNRRLLREPGYRARSLKMGSPSRSVSHWLTQFHNGEKSWGIQRGAAEKRLIRGMSRIRVWFQSSDGVDDSERACRDIKAERLRGLRSTTRRMCVEQRIRLIDTFFPGFPRRNLSY